MTPPRWRLGLLLLLLLTACSDRPRLNPLDPGSEVGADPGRLQARAGHAVVELRWDYGHYRDVRGVRLWRRAEGETEAALAAGGLVPAAGQREDRAVIDGTTYTYDLELVLASGTAWRPAAAVRVTPGPDRVWAIDRSAGQVWQVTADGRGAWFVAGRFLALAGAAADNRRGCCWLSDAYARSVASVSSTGGVAFHATPGRQPGPLAVDTDADRGWLIDALRGEVCWWSLAAAGDTLELSPADAHFTQPVALAPAGGGCWVADRSEGRVCYWSPAGQRIEHRDLAQPVSLAAVDGDLWVLPAAGDRVLHFTEAARHEWPVPLVGATVLVWDDHQRCLWVGGTGEVAALSSAGAVLSRWRTAAAVRGLAPGVAAGTVWVASANGLERWGAEGQVKARLAGFAGLLGVTVGPAVEAW
jgi:hypothetical protein